LSRVLRVAAAQSGPIQKADSRQAVVRRMIDLLDRAKTQRCNLVVYCFDSGSPIIYRT
jgi:hypothetical protein